MQINFRNQKSKSEQNNSFTCSMTKNVVNHAEQKCIFGHSDENYYFILCQNNYNFCA